MNNEWMDNGLPGSTELHGVGPRRGGGGREEGVRHRELHFLAGGGDGGDGGDENVCGDDGNGKGE